MRRALLVLSALLAVVALAVGSGGFSSAQVDRSVTVEVVGDEDAYLGLDYPEQRVAREGTVGESVTLPIVTVANQFTESVTLTVNYTVSRPSGAEAVGDSGPTELDVGESTAVSTTVRCPSDADDYAVTVEFGVMADGDGVSAETSETRTVDYLVDCD